MNILKLSSKSTYKKIFLEFCQMKDIKKWVKVTILVTERKILVLSKNGINGSFLGPVAISILLNFSLSLSFKFF